MSKIYLRNKLEMNEIKKSSKFEDLTLNNIDSVDNIELLKTKEMAISSLFKKEIEEKTENNLSRDSKKRLVELFALISLFLTMIFIFLNVFFMDNGKSEKLPIEAINNQLLIQPLSLKGEQTLILKNNFTDEQIEKIAENKVEQLLSINYIDYKNQIVGFSSMFTENTINKYLDELKKNAYLENVKNDKGYFVVTKAKAHLNSILIMKQSNEKSYYVVNVSTTEMWLTSQTKKITKRMITLQLEENPNQKDDLLISNIVINKPLD